MSKRFTWTQEYSVGVEEFDNQHKEWVKICNELLDLSEKEAFTNEEALIQISRLGNYAHYHLGTEEELFIEIKYPDAPAHVAAHNHFRDKVQEFINQIRDPKVDSRKVLNEMATFTVEWLFDHILVVDKEYTKFFNEHGVK